MLDRWDRRFIDLAEMASTWSKDPRTKVGAVLVSPDRRHIEIGYNGFPHGIYDSELRLSDRTIKNRLVLHAEHNAILNAARDISDWTLYSTKCLCSRCALVSIQSRIGRIVMPNLDMLDDWYSDQEDAYALLREANIEVYFSNDK